MTSIKIRRISAGVYNATQGDHEYEILYSAWEKQWLISIPGQFGDVVSTAVSYRDAKAAVTRLIAGA